MDMTLIVTAAGLFTLAVLLLAGVTVAGWIFYQGMKAVAPTVVTPAFKGVTKCDV